MLPTDNPSFIHLCACVYKLPLKGKRKLSWQVLSAGTIVVCTFS